MEILSVQLSIQLNFIQIEIICSKQSLKTLNVSMIDMMRPPTHFFPQILSTFLWEKFLQFSTQQKNPQRHWTTATGV